MSLSSEGVVLMNVMTPMVCQDSSRAPLKSSLRETSL